MANTNNKKGSVPAKATPKNTKPTAASNAKLIKDLAAEAAQAREAMLASITEGQRRLGDAIAETNENIAMVEENSQARHEESLRVGRQHHEESLQAIEELSEKFDSIAYEDPLSGGAKVVVILIAIAAAIAVWIITAVAGWTAWMIVLAVVGTFAAVMGLLTLLATFFHS